MPIIKSAIKQVRKVKFKTSVNRVRRSKYKSTVKEIIKLIDGNKKKEALDFLPKLNSELMKVGKTGAVSKKKLSRVISRLTIKINKIKS